MNRYRTLAVAAILSLTLAGGSLAGASSKATKPAAKKASTQAAQYECTMCKIKMSAKEAKAHGYKCPDCGMKMTLVKNAKKGAKGG